MTDVLVGRKSSGAVGWGICSRERLCTAGFQKVDVNHTFVVPAPAATGTLSDTRETK